MDIVYFIKALFRRKWILIGVPLLAIICALVFTRDFKRLYKSNAQLTTGFTVNEQVKLTDERFNVYEADIKFSNVLETLTSTKVISLLSYSLMIHDLEGVQPPFRKIEDEDKKAALLRKLDLNVAKDVLQNHLDSMKLLTSFDPEEKKLLELLKLYKYDYAALNEMLFVTRVKRTDYIEIQFFSANPELSAYVVNGLCQEFLRYYNSLWSERSNETVETFANLVEQKRRELSEKEEALRMFKSSQRVLNVEAESASQIEQIASYESTLSEARRKSQALTLSIHDLDKRLNDLSSGNRGLLASNSNNADILTIREQINALNKEYISNGSNDEQLLGRINNLRNQLYAKLDETNGASSYEGEDQLSRSDLISKKRDLETELTISQDNVRSLESKLVELRNIVGTYASKEARVATLERDLALASQEYLSAQEKYNTALNVNLAAGHNIRQTLEGQPAVEPESSKRLITTALSGVTSFILCVMIVIFLEYIDVSIKTPSNFKKQLKSDIIGVINKLNPKDITSDDLFRDKSRKHEEKDTFRDLIRKIRFEIENSGKKVILFASTVPGAGKTTIIQAVSQTLSLGKKKVLIIDTNFSNNALTRELDGKLALGGHNIASDDFMEIMRFVRPTRIPNVDILGCSRGDYSPSEVFPEGRFINKLKEIGSQYDYVFLEGSAMNQYTDSKELTRYVEGVILVFAADSVIKPWDKESIAFLEKQGSRFIGSILNKIKTENIN